MGAETIRERCSPKHAAEIFAAGPSRRSVARRTSYIGLRDAADLAGVPYQDILDLHRDGKMPFVQKLGRHWWMRVGEFTDWWDAYKDRMKVKPRKSFKRATVYFVQAGAFVKIGMSTSVEKRLKTIQTHSPVEAVLLFTLKGGATAERDFHKRFAAYRATNEWFRIEGELAAFIEEKRNG